MGDKCEWTRLVVKESSPIYFATTCDMRDYFDYGGLADNSYKLCPYCGKPIEAKEVKDNADH